MEQWKPVVGWEELYEVSDQGRVRSISDANPNTYVGRLRIISAARDGRRRITLCRNTKQHTYLLHRLVADAFLGPRPVGKEVNHIDGDPTNNRIENLEYVTRAENMLHAYRTGIRKPVPSYGEKNGGGGKLTSEKVAEIRRLYATGKFRQKDLGAMFGVSQPMIGNITRGQSWASPT